MIEYVRHCDGRHPRDSRVTPQEGHCMICTASAHARTRTGRRHVAAAGIDIIACCVSGGCVSGGRVGTRAGGQAARGRKAQSKWLWTKGRWREGGVGDGGDGGDGGGEVLLVSL